ncbi:MAG: hypothetical protein ACPG4K_05545 [Haloferula sp.]
MKKLIVSLIGFVTVLESSAAEFRHIGDFIIRSRIKVSSGQIIPTTIKPLRLSAFTDGITVRISAQGEVEQASEYEIYRSDGIGRQRTAGGALEVVPGVQAKAQKGGVLRQLRLTEDTLTITTFPGVSNQTVITYAVVAPPPKAVPATKAPDAAVNIDS